MNRIPPEVDRLMWAVAEAPNPDAMGEFGDRYPELRSELLKRVEMVRGLRQEVNGATALRSGIPKFDPKPVQVAAPAASIMVAYTLGLAAIVFAAYTAVISFRPPEPVPAQNQLETILNKPIDLPKVIYSQPNVQTQRAQPTFVPTPPVEPPQNPAPLSERRRDLDLKDVQMLDALSLITAGTSLHLEIGPGFVNQKVSIAFRGRTTLEMLREMAKEYAFTISDEGNGQLLVLPVPDDGARGGSGSEPSRKVGP